MKYCLVSYGSEERLVEEVEALMAQGWKPQGGVSVGAYTYTTQYREPGWGGSETQQRTGVIYAQAMIHEQLD